MSRGPQHPLQEGQELIGILDTDDLLEEDDDNESDRVIATGESDPEWAPWDQLIAAVDREFFPHESEALWGAPRFRTK